LLIGVIYAIAVIIVVVIIIVIAVTRTIRTATLAILGHFLLGAARIIPVNIISYATLICVRRTALCEGSTGH